MTIKEIKADTNMADVLSRYGLKPNRSGFISCPFHGKDKTPSMKIYTDHFHCFACGAHGDVFRFVMQMEHVDFRTAFAELGGNTGQPSNSSLINSYLSRKQRDADNRQKVEKAARVSEITQLETRLKELVPFSDEWADTMTRLEMARYHAGFYDE